MTALQRRRPHYGEVDDDLVAQFVREILSQPPGERTEFFTDSMLAYRRELYEAHPMASRRKLTARAQQLGLRILHEIGAATHRLQLAEVNKQRS